MKRGWAFLLGALLWGQIEVPDSLERLFDRDVRFDVVVGRSFPVMGVMTDTFPVVPLLSGSVRIGLSWRWGVGGQRSRQWLVTLSPLFLFEKVTFRATTASVVPGIDLIPEEKYLWFKYRSGAAMIAGGLRFQRWEAQALFPKWWVELGAWGAYRVGRSMKYVTEREGRTEKVRIEGNPHLAPLQGGLYGRVGRQWAFAEVYYHVLPYFRSGMYGKTLMRPYPRMPRWEVGIGIAL